MNDRLAPVRSLDPKLKRLQKNTSALRDKFNSDLARETADGLADRDGPKRAIGLTKGHDGGTTNVGTNLLRDLAPKQDADHLGKQPQKHV